MEDQPQKQGRRVGRPPKTGPKRAQLHAQVPATIIELLRKDAAEHKVSQGDRLAEILAGFYAKKETMRQAS